MKKKYIAIIICMIFIVMIAILSNIFLIKTVEVIYEKQPQYTNEMQIVEASQIKMKTNIFNLNEKNVRNNISGSFTNNTVSVTDVQRIFPNTVKIFIKERKPLLIVPYGSLDGEECIPTDIDFQMVSPINKSQIDYDAITINGIYVDTSFNLASFRQINEILHTFIDEFSFNEDSLIAFIKEINVTYKNITLVLNGYDCVFEFKTDSTKKFSEQTKELYQQYLDLPHNQRNIFQLSI